MSNSLHIVCPNCNSTNSVPAERLGAHPRCGKCKDRIFQARPVELRASNFQKHILKSHIPIVVDFWAAWCGPCKMMAPVFQQASAQLEPAVRLAKVNTEQEQSLAAQYEIRSIPTLVLFRGGIEIARQSGAMDLSGLIQWVRSRI
ncbi:MAG: thioredoxin TrxC [Nitrospiraceae bacterium]|nr:MAG: thioredoxin TrxC [Nitrospiraceae bacterium]